MLKVLEVLEEVPLFILPPPLLAGPYGIHLRYGLGIGRVGVRLGVRGKG